MACVGVQAKLAAAADDRGRNPVRGLEEHAARGVGDAGVVAAHDPAQRNCARGLAALAVGHHQQILVERHGAAVEQLHLLARVRMTHHDRPLQRVLVEGVHRLAEFEHHVLGHVDQETDRAHAAAAQAFGHPWRRRRGRVHAVEHTADEARHLGAGIKFDDQRRIAAGRDRRGVERHDFAVAGGGDVERNAAHAEAVGAVRGELQFDAGVRKTKIFDQRRPDRRVGRQFQQAGSVGVDAEFLRRAQHAVGIDIAQFRGLDREVADPRADGGERRDQARTRVRRTADDLLQTTHAGIDLTDLQAVGFRMFGAFDDPRHDHAVERCAEDRQFFDFETDGGERRREFVARSIGLDVLAQPVFGEFHQVTVGRALARRFDLSYTSVMIGTNSSFPMRMHIPRWRA